MTPNWNTYFMNLLELLASRSKDPNTKVACVVVAPDNSIRMTGYNSFPRGINDNVPERYERPEKYYWMEHAERNAFYASSKAGISLDGCRIYQVGLPCMDCGRGLIGVGITELIYDSKKQEEWAKTTPKYVPDFERVQTLLSEGHIKITEWSPDA